MPDKSNSQATRRRESNGAPSSPGRETQSQQQPQADTPDESDQDLVSRFGSLEIDWPRSHGASDERVQNNG
jgi:hypothetical protein